MPSSKRYLSNYLLNHVNQDGVVNTKNIIVYFLLKLKVHEEGGFIKGMIVPEVGGRSYNMYAVKYVDFSFPSVMVYLEKI